MTIADGARHLWECEHAYYCNDANFYAKGCLAEYRRWQDFIAAEGGDDFDYNLIFRWDWIEQYGDEAPTFNGDVYYRNGTLKIYWMGQRKGAFRITHVSVCRADEPDVIKFLQPRMDYLAALWAPLKPSHNTERGPLTKEELLKEADHHDEQARLWMETAELCNSELRKSEYRRNADLSARLAASLRTKAAQKGDEATP